MHSIPDDFGDPGAGLNWLYVDMNSFFASCEAQDNPALRGKPLIVVPVKSDYTCAIAASYPAKDYGIKTGTQVKEAKALCPDLLIVEARPNRYVHYHHNIIEAVERVVPVDRVCSIDEVACRLMGPERTELAARALGYRIQRAILERVGGALTSSVGIGPSRLLAKTAADMHKPLGLTLLRQDELPGPLLALPLKDFPGIGPAMQRRLGEAGIYTTRHLWDLPPTRLRQIWGGIGGDNFWYALHGVDPPDIETIRNSISHSHVLGGALRPLDHARPVARRLVSKCGSRLRRMGYKCTGLHLSIRADKGTGRAQAQMSFGLTSDSFRLLEALDELWTVCVKKLNAPRIKKVSVTCLNMVPVGAEPDLFGWTAEQDEDERHMRLLSALDGLNQKFGKDAVSIGPRPIIHSFVGAKIAFNRVPEVSEFRE